VPVSKNNRTGEDNKIIPQHFKTSSVNSHCKCST
jgi:hypothetical protein